jgi:hypothetical protein
MHQSGMPKVPYFRRRFQSVFFATLLGISGNYPQLVPQCPIIEVFTTPLNGPELEPEIHKIFRIMSNRIFTILVNLMLLGPHT